MSGLSESQQEIAFIIKAKKENPNVTINECMEITGYTSDDQKEQNNLKQKFRNNIILPLKIYLGQKLFNLTPEQARSIWSHKPLVDNHEEIRAAINDKLPSTRRATVVKNNMTFIDNML